MRRSAPSGRLLTATFCALLVALTSVVARAQDDDVWDFKSKSTSLTTTGDGERVYTLRDDVIILHGELVATCERARYLDDSQRCVMTGYVVMRQDSTVIRAPVATYYRQERRAEFPQGLVIERPTATAVADRGEWWREEDRFELAGEAAVADTSGTIDADRMTYDTLAEIFFATGNSRFVDEASGLVVESEFLRHEQLNEITEAYGEPKAVFEDEGGVPIRVDAEKIFLRPFENVAIARNDVVIVREGMTATADSAMFFRDDSRTELIGSPRLIQSDTEVSGNWMQLQSRSEGRRDVRIEGNAQVASRLSGSGDGSLGIELGQADVDSLPSAEELEEARDEFVDAVQAILEPKSDAPEPEITLPPLAELPSAPLLEKSARDDVAAVADSVAARSLGEGRVQHLLDLAKRMGQDTTKTPTDALEALGTGGEARLSELVDSLASGLDSASVAGVQDSLARTLSVAADSAGASDSVEVDDRPEWLKTPSDRLPKQNLLFGEVIEMTFQNDDLERVFVVGHGRSKYFPREASGELSEWNDVVGDTLYVWFGDTVDSVHVVGNGEGQYRFASAETGKSAQELKNAGRLVDYKAPRIRYVQAEDTMHLDQGAEVQYKSMVLTSEKIDFDAAKETMEASGDPPPLLIDREDEIHGQVMNYHLPSQVGRIHSGRTEFDQGYYRGLDVWKMGENELAVDHAIYTTCDLDEPHYHFSCRNMKIYLDDKMVARPVVFKIKNIPVFALPFYMTSLKKDRHSGFILPNLEFGVDDNRGRFIRNVGYYWAPNDYLDSTLKFDFYPSQDRIVSYLDTRYHLRYRYDGSLNLLYNRDVQNNRRETAVRWQHNQEFGDGARLTASANFVSDNSIFRNVDDEDRLNRDLRSNLTYSKRFAGSRNLRIEARRNENLDTGVITQTLPTIDFSQPSLPLAGRRDVGGLGSSGDEGSSLLEKITYSLNSRFVSTNDRDANGDEESQTGSNVRVNFRTSSGAARFGSINASLNTEGTWIDEDAEGNSNAIRGTFRTSVGASSNIYGTWLMDLGPFKGFRHSLTPSVSWSWAPEFDQYFFTDSTGVRRDRFLAFGGLSGTQRESNSMSFSLNNLFQTKFGLAEQVKRYDVASLNSQVSYNFLTAKEGGWAWSNVSTSLRILQSAPISQSWRVIHDSQDGDLLQSSVTTQATLSSAMFRRDPSPADVTGLAGDGFGGTESGAAGLARGPRSRAGEWRVTLSHSATRTPGRDGIAGQGSGSLSVRTNWTPTENWQIDFNTQYDLEEGVNTSQTWGVLRRVHRWEISFRRRLLGREWQYGLQVSLSDLPDIKVERGDDVTGSGFNSIGNAFGGGGF